MRRLLFCSTALLLWGAQAHAGSLNGGGSLSGIVATGTATLTAAQTAALAKATTSLQSSQLGVASGIATLDSSRHVLSAQMPFGTTAGTVPDAAAAATALSAVSTVANSALQKNTDISSTAQVTYQLPGMSASRTGTFTTLMQDVATYMLSASKADGGIVHAIGLNGAVESFGRTLSAKTGDVFNVAEHGADGVSAANDDAALAEGLALAATRAASNLGTHIVIPTFPSGQFPLAVNATYPGFAVPSLTTLEQMDENSNVITWNDQNTGGYGLFYSASSATRYHDVTFRNITVQGTWGPASACLTVTCSFANTSGHVPIFLGQIDNVTMDHVTSLNSSGFGMTVRASTNVRWLSPKVAYSNSDGINNDDDFGVFAENINIQHVADDCFSAHSDEYDQGGVRRNIIIRGGLCFDTHPIDIASPDSTIVDGVLVDSFKGSAFSFSATAGSGGTEGHSAGLDVVVSNSMATNGINLAKVDSNDPTSGTGLNYVVIGAPSSQAGNLDNVPGEVDTKNGTVISPYQYVLNQGTSSTIPVPAWRNVIFQNDTFTRHFPSAAAGSLTTWANLEQGQILSKDGVYTPNLGNYLMFGPGITVENGYIKHLDLFHNNFAGLSTAVYMPSGDSGRISDLQVKQNSMTDMDSNCIDIEFGGKIDGVIDGNTCDLDPYMTHNRGSVGNWQSGVGSGVGWYITVPGLIVTNNILKDASEDTNVNTSDPTTGDMFANNIDMTNTSAVDSFTSATIGYVHSSGFRLVQYDGNPSSSTYGQILSVPVDAATAMPTAGLWAAGTFVRNTAAPASGATPILGWYRQTTGTGATAGTDWITVHAQ